MNKHRGNLYIVTGPSGAGKGTVLGRVLTELEDVFLSVSATTRSPREGERDGVSYFFVDLETFRRMIEEDELLEHAEYVGNFYGTPAAPVDAMLASGKDVVLEIEVQGALIVKEKRPDATLVFIAPPSFEVLAQRLRSRGTESEEVVQRRLIKAHEECARMEAYDYIIVNDALDDAVRDLSAVILAGRCRRGNVTLDLY